MQHWYRLDRAQAPWGDYGAILVSGMAYRDETARLVIMRTAPWVPPITVIGVSDLVITDAFRRRLEASGLTGFHFAEVVKQHIVRLDWRHWDLTAPEPAWYPP